MKAKTPPPRLELLEDRLTPSLTYIFDAAGDLSVTGTTVNPTLTITEAPGNAVTVMDGASSKTFAVTGNLNVNVLSLNALYLVTYNVGGTVLGNVSLNARSLGSVDMLVGGTAASTINGSLTLKTGGGDDLVSINAFGGTAALTVAGSLTVDTGGGTDTLAIGGAANVAVGGNLFAYNVNTMFFGSSTETVGGLTYITTDANTLGGFNSISTSTTTTMAGNLFLTGSNASQLIVLLEGTVAGRLFATLGNGAGSELVNEGTVLDSVYVSGGSGGDVVVLGGTVGGNVAMTMGNGGNNVSLTGTVGGTSISYYGGNGGDTFTFAAINAAGAHLTAIFGNGNDTVNFSSTSLASAYLNGGFGTNTFSTSLGLVIDFPLTLVNF